MALLGAPPHGGMSGALLKSTIQRLPRGHPGRPSIPHNFQHGGGCRDTALGYAGHMVG